MRHLRQPVPVVPGVLGDVGVTRVELAVLIGVDEAVRAVPLGIVEVTVGAVGEKLVVRAGGVGAAVGGNAVAVGLPIIPFQITNKLGTVEARGC
ncbi:hypothetical protein [Thermogutta sp.]|uniref:hypothetical protein n=1 Tax=Thermogutta sp. TaxID=1962930 RepID=UPI0032209F44